MACIKSCGIAIVFFVSMIYMCIISPIVLDESKEDVMKALRNTLSTEQKNTLERIKQERMQIHFKGYAAGLFLSSIIILYRFMHPMYNKYMTPMGMFCITAATTFVVNYFYYILSPKTEWMVTTLHNEEQKKAWLKVYRHMQVNYHIGFVLGIMAVGFMSRGVCMCN